MPLRFAYFMRCLMFLPMRLAKGVMSVMVSDGLNKYWEGFEF